MQRNGEWSILKDLVLPSPATLQSRHRTCGAGESKGCCAGPGFVTVLSSSLANGAHSSKQWERLFPCMHASEDVLLYYAVVFLRDN